MEMKDITISDIVYSLIDFKELLGKINNGESRGGYNDFNLDRIDYILNNMWKVVEHNYYSDSTHGKKHIFDVIQKGFKILEWYLIRQKKQQGYLAFIEPICVNIVRGKLKHH